MCSDVVRPALLDVFLDALLVSTLSVAIAEIGDKTQLLALLLACRYRRFWPLFWGILIATLANHGLAGLAGQWLAGVFLAGHPATAGGAFIHRGGTVDADS